MKKDKKSHTFNLLKIKSFSAMWAGNYEKIMEMLLKLSDNKFRIYFNSSLEFNYKFSFLETRKINFPRAFHIFINFSEDLIKK